MKVLSLDTSTLMATCAVIENNKLVGEYSVNQDMSHSENLMPMIEELFKNLKMDIKDIDLYCVAIGPGSFTGLRIGLATMKAFAHLFDKPIVGVSTLEALAYNMAYSNIVIPMIDARRNRVYTAIYKWEKEELIEVLSPQVLEVDHLLDEASKYDNVSLIGDGTDYYKEKISEKLKDKAQIARLNQNVCKAGSVGEIGLMKYKKGYKDDYFTLAPSYLRETQAQRELKERQK
ncbi:MAG TPA: tRNA (adenosine(37)-N6)-threonylcarbamoyltransferase complex dimerization subunit type 1 TsaB [Tissierellaceae bacterium]